MDSAFNTPPDTQLIELSSKVIFTIRHQLDLPFVKITLIKTQQRNYICFVRLRKKKFQRWGK